MKWDYYVDGKIDPRPVAWALNGYKLEGSDWSQGFESNADGATLAKGSINLLPGYAKLEADGSTACGMWIYSGFYANNDAPLSAESQPVYKRNNVDTSGLGLYSDWAYAWPNNRRVIYNRRFCRPSGSALGGGQGVGQVGLERKEVGNWL